MTRGRSVAKYPLLHGPRRGPFWGRGGVPSVPGGRRVGAPAARRPGGERGERGGGGGEGGPPRRSPSPWGMLVLWGLPGGRGRRARPGRPPVGQCGGGGGEGGCDLLALVRAPAFPRPASEWAAPFAPSWAPPFRGRSAAGNVGACGRFTGGAWRAAALAAAAVLPPLGAAASSWGCGAAVSPVGLRPLLGRGGGGERGGPSGPLTPPPDGCGEAAWRFRPRGASRRLGGRTLPPPPSTL